MNLLRQLDRLRQLPAQERVWLIQAVPLLVAVRVGLWLLPFRVSRNLVARIASRRRTEPAVQGTAQAIGQAVERAGRAFGAPCLPRAMAGYVLLRRNGHLATLHIGVNMDDRSLLQAHAWVEYGGQVLVGDSPTLASYTRLPSILADADRAVKS